MPRRKHSPPRDPTQEPKDENQAAQHLSAFPDVNATPRVAQALRLRRLGYTYETIAQMCGYQTESGARKAIKKASAAIIRDEARELVSFQLDHLDAALQVVMARITRNDENSLWAVDRLIPLLKRQSELMGLDVKPDASQSQAQMIVIGVPEAVLEAV